MKLKSQLLLISIFLLVLTSLVNATYTATLEDADLRPTDTVQVNIQVTDNPQKGDPYTANWYNSSNSLLESDTGNLASIINGIVSETYVTPSTANWTNAYVNVTSGGVTTQLFFNVTGAIGNAIVISDCIPSPEARTGRFFAIDCQTADISGNLLSNARCDIFGSSTNDAPLQHCTAENNYVESFGGRVTCGGILSDTVTEGNEYLAKIRCTCGVGDGDKCYDRDGNTYTGYEGEAIIPFTVSKWLNVNTITDRRTYDGHQIIQICANVTNVNFAERISLDIYYQLRCGGNDTATNRDVIGANRRSEPDVRGISTNTTQNQCGSFYIDEKSWLQGKTSSCYASSEVWVLNAESNRIKGYFTTSPELNITISDLNLNPDWSISGSNNTIATVRINLSDDGYRDYSGEGIGNVDVRLEKHALESTSPYFATELGNTVNIEHFFEVQAIKTYNATYCNGTAVTNQLEILNDGNIEIELRDVDQSTTGCYDVNVVFYNYDERQTLALESSTTALQDIANKTGIFHLDINCPEEATNSITCQLTAFIEDLTVPHKETQFDCSINNIHSQTIFLQSINSTPYIADITFNIDNLDNEPQTATCKANYYHMGSRSDSFSDTFIKVAPTGGNQGGSDIQQTLTIAPLNSTEEEVLDLLQPKEQSLPAKIVDSLIETVTEPEGYISILLICLSVILISISRTKTEIGGESYD